MKIFQIITEAPQIPADKLKKFFDGFPTEVKDALISKYNAGKKGLADGSREELILKNAPDRKNVAHVVDAINDMHSGSRSPGDANVIFANTSSKGTSDVTFDDGKKVSDLSAKELKRKISEIPEDAEEMTSIIIGKIEDGIEKENVKLSSGGQQVLDTKGEFTVANKIMSHTFKNSHDFKEEHMKNLDAYVNQKAIEYLKELYLGQKRELEKNQKQQAPQASAPSTEPEETAADFDTSKIPVGEIFKDNKGRTFKWEGQMWSGKTKNGKWSPMKGGTNKSVTKLWLDQKGKSGDPEDVSRDSIPNTPKVHQKKL